METFKPKERTGRRNLAQHPKFDPETIHVLRKVVKKGESTQITGTISRNRNGRFEIKLDSDFFEKYRGNKHSETVKHQDPMARIRAGDEFQVTEFDESLVLVEIKNALTPAETVELTRVSRTTLCNYREKMDLLGLPIGKKKFVFPKWQLDKSGQPIPQIKTILKLLDPIAPEPVDKMIQLLIKSDFYGGKSIKDLITEGNPDRAVEATNKRLMLC